MTLMVINIIFEDKVNSILVVHHIPQSITGNNDKVIMGGMVPIHVWDVGYKWQRVHVSKCA